MTLYVPDHLVDNFDPDPLGEAKFKRSQNKSPADRLCVVSALGQQDNPDADAIASLMMYTLMQSR